MTARARAGLPVPWNSLREAADVSFTRPWVPGDDQGVPPDGQQNTRTGQQRDLVHWHLLRGDSLRAGLAARAGTLLSTNALIIAGVALALGLNNRHSFSPVLAVALATFVCVAFSVINASLVLMTVRPWHRLFRDTETPRPFLYSYTGMTGGSFEEFKARLFAQSPERLLEYALVELWRCGRLHNYRYRKLRHAVRWLLAAAALLFITIGLSAV